VRAEDVFREANKRVAANAGELKFAHSLPFLCERRDRHCFARISLTLEEYEQLRSDPAHAAPKRRNRPGSGDRG
jgi:hypothetical protein